jgi:hypothetical protein
MTLTQLLLGSKQKKAASIEAAFIIYINIVGAQEGTRTPTKLLAST